MKLELWAHWHREQTRTGLAKALAAGRHLGRPPLPPEVGAGVRAAAIRFGPRIRKIARELDLSPSTVSRLLKQPYRA